MSIDRAGGQSAAHGILRYATAPGSSSFTDFLAAAAPDLLPRPVPASANVPHGTTIVAAEYDRRCGHGRRPTGDGRQPDRPA